MFAVQELRGNTASNFSGFVTGISYPLPRTLEWGAIAFCDIGKLGKFKLDVMLLHADEVDGV